VSSSVHAQTNRSIRLQQRGHNVREARQILRRLARQKGPATPQILHILTRSTPIRARAKGTDAPKIQGEGESITQILLARANGRFAGNETNQAAKLIIATAGSLAPRQLRAAHIAELSYTLDNHGYCNTTKAIRARAVRRILRELWEDHGAPKLDTKVRRYAAVKPRNVTGTEAEIYSLLDNAEPHLHLWLLLCSDLAIRSGTAAKIGLDNYDPGSRVLNFTTKYSAKLRMPVTDEIATILDTCDQNSRRSYVKQLWDAARKSGRKPKGNNANAGTLNQQFAKLRTRRA
jgi:hypothetical protein